VFERSEFSLCSKHVEKHREPEGQAWAALSFGSVFFMRVKKMNALRQRVKLKTVTDSGSYGQAVE
jgi:hypothetical protein